MSRVTTHILDLVLGKPAADVIVALDRTVAADGWQRLGSAATDRDGRVSELASGALDVGDYRLDFDTEAYFQRHKLESFYPRVVVVFRIADATQNFHLPLLLSQFGYSTYRGS